MLLQVRDGGGHPVLPLLGEHSFWLEVILGGRGHERVVVLYLLLGDTERVDTHLVNKKGGGPSRSDSPRASLGIIQNHIDRWCVP